MFMENHKYALVRITLVTILIAGIFGIRPVQAEAVDFGQGQSMGGPNSDYETAYRRGGGGPDPATIVSPNDTIVTNPVTYAWKQANRATWYQLWVGSGSSGAVLKAWYTSKEAHCNGNICWVTPTKSTLGSGTYTWSVQAWNESGFGEWSEKKGFMVP